MSSKSGSPKSKKPMNAVEKDKFISTQLAFWRQLLSIDPKLKIKVKYHTNREEDEEKKWAAIIRDMTEYRHATMEIYDDVFTAPNFIKEARSAVCHEMLHMALHPLIAYCHNMFTNDEGKQKELERLEEQIVTILEEAFMEVTDG